MVSFWWCLGSGGAAAGAARGRGLLVLSVFVGEKREGRGRGGEKGLMRIGNGDERAFERGCCVPALSAPRASIALQACQARKDSSCKSACACVSRKREGTKAPVEQIEATMLLAEKVLGTLGNQKRVDTGKGG